MKIIVALLSLNLLFQVYSFAQNQKTVIVKDESGNPVAGASVTVGEAAKPIVTNERGEVVIQVEGRTPLLIEASGYASQLIIATPAVDVGNIVLLKTPYQMGDKDNVNVPFGTLKQRQIPGAVVALDSREIQKYDMQKSFTGLLNGRIPGLFGSTNFRQFGSALVVVDGIPRPATDFNLEQIEQVTVLKDLASGLLYGSQAQNGVIFITTRRGEPLKKSMHFTAENGFNKPISYPKYLNAGDYMTLYNEALANDGLTPKYTVAQIDSTVNGVNPVRFPDESYYNSKYLEDYSTYYNVVGEASGGSEIAQYYLNLAWYRTKGLLKPGEGANEKNDRLNMRGNVNYKLTDKIKLTFDGSAIFNLTKAPRYSYTIPGSSYTQDFWYLASTLRPDNTPVLIPVSLMTDKALLGAAKLADGKYLLGGTNQFQTNVYGELTRNGPRLTNDRLIELNTGIDLDLSSIAKGLSASGFLSFDLYNIFYADIMNSYAVYQPNYVLGVGGAPDTLKFTKIKTDVKVDDQTLQDVTFYRRTGAYGTIDYQRIFNNTHNVKLTALAYRDQYNIENVLQPTKHLHFGLRANYMYQNKYVAELTGVYTGSIKLYETDPWGFSPGIGLGWIVSEESFLKSSTLINYLKIRTNWALINTDESLTNYYLGRNLYSSSGSYYYNQGSNNNSGRVLANGNANVAFEKKMNINLGFESLLLDNKLGVEASYFYYKNYDVITRRSNVLPVYFVGLPYENFGSYQTQGTELGLNYTQKFGDIEVRLGTNFTYSVPKALQFDELNYKESYRKVTGKESDAILSYVALGLFKDQAEIDASPVQTFGTVKPGDIKYKDLNGDNQITDADQQIIGNSSARIQYGFNLNLKYKSFELFALGTGQGGSNLYYGRTSSSSDVYPINNPERFFNNLYYWIYGDRKYSEVVWDRWTEATKETAKYPRLTTLTNANNFRNSTFWLYDNDWFTLHTVQLTYLLPMIPAIEEARVFLRGNNLFTISKIKEKIQLNIGSAPQVRVISFGLNVSL